MTARMIALLAFAAVLLLTFMAGHKRGRWSCRFDYPRGWDAGQKAERDWWERATVTTRGDLEAWQRPDEPYDPALPPATMLLADDAAERLAEADAALVPVAELDRMAAEWSAQAGADSHVRTGTSAPGWPGADPTTLYPSPAPEPGAPACQGHCLPSHHCEVCHEPGPPVVADITSAARWRPWEDDTPAITGTVVTPSHHHDPGADWDLLAGTGLPDYAAAALGGHRTVDELVDSIVMRAVKP